MKKIGNIKCNLKGDCSVTSFLSDRIFLLTFAVDKTPGYEIFCGPEKIKSKKNKKDKFEKNLHST